MNNIPDTIIESPLQRDDTEIIVDQPVRSDFADKLKSAIAPLVIEPNGHLELGQGLVLDGVDSAEQLQPTQIKQEKKKPANTATPRILAGAGQPLTLTQFMAEKARELDWWVDGENSINISLDGETVLGRFLHWASNDPFVVPGIPMEFSSVLGYILYVCGHDPANSPSMYGARASRIFNDIRYRSRDTAAMISHEFICSATSEAMLHKVVQYPEVIKMIGDNNLPLTQYYDKPADTGGEKRGVEKPVIGAVVSASRVELVSAHWYTAMCETIAATIKKQKPGSKTYRMPDFSFLAAMQKPTPQLLYQAYLDGLQQNRRSRNAR